MSDNQDPTLKMNREEAGDKGEHILNHVKGLYALVEWKEGKEDGDPYLKVVLYKSGRVTLETYADEEITELQMKEDGELGMNV